MQPHDRGRNALPRRRRIPGRSLIAAPPCMDDVIAAIPRLALTAQDCRRFASAYPGQCSHKPAAVPRNRRPQASQRITCSIIGLGG
ncbi:hypothetical protein SAMN02927923_01744 [Microvirga guangxiensis]|uniref:Uncharacterized protein n=1 Tax=Microvirga guangxiensis TaxID=549386 RepID=A0A1G5H2E1_9HYPH|nr:hypothetical protein SAMN02927923_01744 [Microvirga guangxiensis]